MGLTIKTPVKDIAENPDVLDKVEEKLRSDRGNAYTVAGLMIECFDKKESDLNRPWRDQEKGNSALYGRIRAALEKLRAEGKVKQVKSGKAMHYWYVADEGIFHARKPRIIQRREERSR